MKKNSTANIENKSTSGIVVTIIVAIILFLFIGLFSFVYSKYPEDILAITSRINFIQNELVTIVNPKDDLNNTATGNIDTQIPKTEKGDDAVYVHVEDNQENDVVSATNTTDKVAEYTANYYGKLKVVGTKIYDINNNPIQLKGVSTHGLNYYGQYVNDETIKWLRNDLGINVFRLVNYTAENGGYLWNGEENKLKLESIIDTGVNACVENNMYAIIDWHILSDGNPNSNVDEAKRFFDKMSSKYAKNENVIYEICNEPNGGVNWNEIKKYAEQVIPVIRANSPDAIILVGTPNWCQDVDVVANDPLKYDNIMYTCHFYAATHGESYRKKVEKAISNGTPIFISEYGLVDAYGSGWINTGEGERWKELIDKYSISCCMWSFCNKAEGASIIKSDVGKLDNFSEDDLTEHGKWLKNRMLSN